MKSYRYLLQHSLYDYNKDKRVFLCKKKKSYRQVFRTLKIHNQPIPFFDVQVIMQTCPHFQLELQIHQSEH